MANESAINNVIAISVAKICLCILLKISRRVCLICEADHDDHGGVNTTTSSSTKNKKKENWLFEKKANFRYFPVLGETLAHT
jgi:hypothetical protein